MADDRIEKLRRLAGEADSEADGEGEGENRPRDESRSRDGERPGGELPPRGERHGAMSLRELAGRGGLRDAAEDFGSQFLRSISDVATGAVNLAAGGIEYSPAGLAVRGTSRATTGEDVKLPRLESEEVAESLPGVATEDPESASGRMGRMSGLAFSLAPPMGGTAAFVPRAQATLVNPTKAQRLLRGLRNFVPAMGERFRRSPGATVAGETALGGTAGLGGHVAAEKYPDSDAAEMVGELVGGTAPAFMPTRLAMRGANIVRRFAGKALGSSVPEDRAAQRLQGAIPEGERARVRESLDEPTTIDPETGQPVLTPAQRTGEPVLLSLEKSVMDSSEALAREADAQIARANRVIQDSARDIGGDVGSLEQHLGESLEYTRNLINTRMRTAAQRTDERLANMRTDASRADVNRVAREEIQKAREAARQQEREFFERLPQNNRAPTETASQTFQAERMRLTEANRNHMPAVAKRLLDPESDSFIGETASLRQLRNLQSELRRISRNATQSGAGQNLNRARIADEIANSINEDILRIEGGEDIADQVAFAVGFSRQVQQAFKQGTVGRILGRDAQGGSRMAEGLTLEQTIGSGGPRGRESFDEIMKALDNPEIVEQSGFSSDEFIGATKNFVRQQFLRRAVPDGQNFDVSQARKFLRDNEELVSRVPGLSDEIEGAIQSGNVANIVRRRRENTRFGDARQSKTAMIIQDDPIRAFDRITDQPPGLAARDAQMLANRARRDDTGQAMAGLKGGFVENLLKPESTRDIGGTPFVSGNDLRERLNNPSTRAAMRRIFDEDEIGRLETIANDLINLERRRKAQPSPEGIGDTRSKILETIAGVTGAAAGRRATAAMGGGGTVQIPGIFANRFRELVDAGVPRPMERLIQDALADETLFRELLNAPIGPGGEISRNAERSLNAWAAAVIAEQGGVFRDEDTDELQDDDRVERLRALTGGRGAPQPQGGAQSQPQQPVRTPQSAP